VQEGPLAPIYLKSLAIRENGDAVMAELNSEFDDDSVESASPPPANKDDTHA
jgi:hypothetical protein